MITFTELFLLAAAVWRITNMLLYEDGPKNVFGWLRVWVFRDSDDVPLGSLRYAFTCVGCMSMLVALPVWVLWAIAPVAAIVVAGAFCLSAISFWIEKLLLLMEGGAGA